MSETAKHDDIEDVLSSIRRLVSDSAATDRRDHHHTPPVERLVLTPALRIAEPDSTFAQSPEPTLPDAHALEDEGRLVEASEAEAVVQTLTMDDAEVPRFEPDETSPDQPIAELTDLEFQDQRSGEPRFGLQSFTSAFNAADEFRDTSDVVMFRNADAPLDDTHEADAALDEAPTPEHEPENDLGPSQVENSFDEGNVGLSDESEAAGDWPAPDEAYDAPAEHEPEAWADAPDHEDATAPVTDETVAEQDASEQVDDDATDGLSDVAVTAEDAAWQNAAEAAFMGAPTGVSEPEPEPEPEVIDADEPETAQNDSEPPETVQEEDAFAHMAGGDVAPERTFEPEHGDTEWSDVETVQPALDIAAVRQARGEEIHPNAAPEQMPVFARSRRRAATSLDDLIPGEPEAETFADAVSQALADGALDRAGEGEEPAPEDIATEVADSPLAEDLDTVDEEALRDLIAQVVREELQGVLGQRITRNVRKMVRREIRLALAAEDFE